MLPLKVRFGSVGSETPQLRRMRQTVAYSSASAWCVHQSGSAVPVVPLVCPLTRSPCARSRAKKASGSSR